MATTTNYSWTTPDDTALVKDGASAIRSLGTSIDTTTKALNPSTTLGDIEYRSSTANTNTRLGIGTSGQVLTVSSGVPAWTTISSGGMTLISEQTASASTGIDFTSISGSYKQLMLVWTGIYHSAASTNFTLRFNSDSGSNYYTTGLFLENSSASINSGGSTSFNGSPFGNSVTSTALQERCNGQLLIDNYASTSKFKNVQLAFNYTQGATTQRFLHYVGAYASTSAITAVNIVRTSGTGTLENATSTSIRLYGIA